MAVLHYTAEVRNGLLLALPSEAEELHLQPGDKVQIQLDITTETQPLARPNLGMLSALREIAERQQGRPYTDSSDTDRLLREARSGAMWGQNFVE
jgi:hypothetical protein